MNDAFYFGKYLTIESITRSDDDTMTDCKIRFNGKERTIPFLHHENRDVTDIRTVFAFLINEAGAYEIWPTVEEYYKGMYPIEYQEDSTITEDLIKEHERNRDAYEKLHELFGHGGYELISLLADCI